METLAVRVEAEVAALHVAFERWLRGESDDVDRVHAALGPAFTFVSPQGDVLTRPRLLENLRGAHGQRPELRIRVEQVALRWHDDTAVLATYEEWHDHPGYTTGRQATALLAIDAAAPGGLTWLHVHETWKVPPPHRQ